jgi:methionyl-tRNA synthetase
LLVLLLTWDAIWRGLALWRAGRNNQPGWFVALAVLNTIGILPIYYLFLVDQPKSSRR